ncbi:MAG TPA: ribonuclease R [Vicinamibacterales bacterium]
MLNDDQILALMRDRVDRPAAFRELLQILKIPREERPAFRRRIKGLVASGALIETRTGHIGLPDRMHLVVGRLEMNPQGFGFVVPERPLEGVTGDLYIAGNHLQDAMHGDRVVARIEHVRERGRAEGRIVRVLERSTTSVVGRYVLDTSGLGFVVPFDRKILMDIQVQPTETRGAQPGDMVTVEITRFPTPTRGPAGRIVEVLGDIDAPGVDIQIIIRKYGINDVHSDEAIAEATRLGRAVRPKDLEGRTDFRNVPTVTIDGEHARDFDDAISIERLPNGNYWLGVHIADVSHYVREGSALDREAYERGTSVYFPERAVHMFPAELSTGLCSLNPHVDRLVQSCLMEVNRKGEVVRYELHDGVIHSDQRMTYTAVNAILTDRDPATREQYRDLVPMFELMGELFHILNGRRRRRGSIDFDLPENELILDDAGRVEAVLASERNVAHRLIEEFMLLANETVAQHLADARVPTLYRIHERPDPLKVEEFEEFISSFGYSLGAPATAVQPKHFQRLVKRIQGTPEERAIAMLMLRTMQKARYDTVNLGHFGLAAKSYVHFTSPIRRYPDLVVHRTLRALRHGKITEERLREWEEEFPEAARHTSDRERRADEAERELVQWKKVRFMADKVGEEFEGYIIGVAPFGLFVELIEHFVDGLVHISTMADDYYRFIERKHVLQGENTGKTYRLGDRVTVQVTRVDMERRQIDLGLSEILEKVRQSERHRGPRRTRTVPKAEARKRAQRPGRRERERRRAPKRRR